MPSTAFSVTAMSPSVEQCFQTFTMFSLVGFSSIALTILFTECRVSRALLKVLMTPDLEAEWETLCWGKQTTETCLQCELMRSWVARALSNTQRTLKGLLESYFLTSGTKHQWARPREKGSCYLDCLLHSRKTGSWCSSFPFKCHGLAALQTRQPWS